MSNSAIPTIENIRANAAVLKGVPKTFPPDINGVSLRWDSAAGGFIFPRRHASKVLAAVDGGSATERSDLEREIDGAAAQVNDAPSAEQATAGNYRKGRFKWNGLDLSIETAKGKERRGVGPDGVEWSVFMPAHYGDIKTTIGADGDPLDFYMGESPESDVVVVVNQVDLSDGTFDEHKIVLGAMDEEGALTIYEDGFSDGKGRARIGSHTVLDVDGLKAWIASGDLSQPTSPVGKPQSDASRSDIPPDDELPLHKVVEGMRDAKVWGRDYGLFTKKQWQGLVREVRANKDLMASTSKEYPNLSEQCKINHAVGAILRERGVGAMTP